MVKHTWEYWTWKLHTFQIETTNIPKIGLKRLIILPQYLAAVFSLFRTLIIQWNDGYVEKFIVFLYFDVF